MSKLRFLADRLLHRDRLDDLLNEEISAHIAQRAEDLERSGLPREEAFRRARLEFGALEKYKEQCRETRRFHLLHDLASDLRFAARLLRKSPGFATVVLLTLTLGIGANAAMFSLLDALVLRNLSVPQPEQLVHFGASPTGEYGAVSLPIFDEISKRQTVFSSTFAWWGDAVMNVEANASLVRADIYAVSGNYYSELGATPELGRLIGPQDASMDREPAMVAVLGYGFWQRAYSGDASVIGKSIRVEGVPFTIIGVIRRDFTGTSAEFAPDVTVPINAEPLINGDTDWRKHLQRRTSLWLDAAGRLKPGVNIAQARAQLQALWPGVRDDILMPSDAVAETATLRQAGMVVESLAKGDSLLRRRFRQPVIVLLGISGLVLLLACTNLAGLMLARATARRHELGIRTSLGATRGRVVRQILAENLLLGTLGTVLGFGFALWASNAILKFVLDTVYVMPASLSLRPDARLFIFGTILALATSVLCGLAAAWNAVHEDPRQAMQADPRTARHAGGVLGRNLVVAQVSISLVLLASAGLLIRSLENLRAIQPGFLTRDILSFELFPIPNGYKNLSWISYYRDLTERVSRLPGVESAGLVHVRFGNVLEWSNKVHEHGSSATGQDVDCEMAMPGWFSTVQIRLLKGRDFLWQDDERAQRVAIVSENFAKRFFPAGDAIGKRVDIASEPKWQDLQIVGIVSDTSLYDIRKSPPPTLYLASTQYGDFMGWSWLMVRTHLPAQSVIASVRATVMGLGHEYVPFVTTVSRDLERSILQERISGMFSAFLSGLALLLAAVGVYGLQAYSVTRRTREIGIRVSLGAQRAEIRSMILKESLALFLLGVVIGLPLALGSTKLVQHMLFGVSAHDPTTIAVTIVALGAAALAAAIVPARRAMRVDPIVALRCE